LAFDYGGKTIGFGSDIDTGELEKWTRRIETAVGGAIRKGDPPPEELAPAKVLSNHAPWPTVTGQAVTLTSPSTITLIIANLAPVGGTVFFGWNLGEVMVLYWGESAVIGFYNLIKMAVISRWLVLFSGPFFLGHFGGFMAVHFLFIYTFFVAGIDSTDTGDNLAKVAQLFFDLWPALLALFVSHGVSFYANFLGRREYQTRTLKDQMTEPYKRIIFMHFAIIFGGGLTLTIGSPALVLLLLIALKTFVDIRAHLKERAVATMGPTSKNE